MSLFDLQTEFNFYVRSIGGPQEVPLDVYRDHLSKVALYQATADASELATRPPNLLYEANVQSLEQRITHNSQNEKQSWQAKKDKMARRATTRRDFEDDMDAELDEDEDDIRRKFAEKRRDQRNARELKRQEALQQKQAEIASRWQDKSDTIDKTHEETVTDTASSIAKRVAFREGYEVEGNYRGNGKWHIARISRVHANSTYDVEYDDKVCQKEFKVGMNMLRSREAPVEAERVRLEEEAKETDRLQQQANEETLAIMRAKVEQEAMAKEAQRVLLKQETASEDVVAVDMAIMDMLADVRQDAATERSSKSAELIKREQEAKEEERVRLEVKETERVRVEAMLQQRKVIKEAERLRAEAEEAERVRIEQEVNEAKRIQLEAEAEQTERVCLELEARETERFRLEQEVEHHAAIMKSARFREGDEVEINIQGSGRWHAGRILRAHMDGTYDIEYDEIESGSGIGGELMVNEDLIRPRKTHVAIDTAIMGMLAEVQQDQVEEQGDIITAEHPMAINTAIMDMLADLDEDAAIEDVVDIDQQTEALDNLDSFIDLRNKRLSQAPDGAELMNCKYEGQQLDLRNETRLLQSKGDDVGFIESLTARLKLSGQMLHKLGDSVDSGISGMASISYKHELAVVEERHREKEETIHMLEADNCERRRLVLQKRYRENALLAGASGDDSNSKHAVNLAAIISESYMSEYHAHLMQASHNALYGRDTVGPHGGSTTHSHSYEISTDSALNSLVTSLSVFSFRDQQGCHILHKLAASRNASAADYHALMTDLRSICTRTNSKGNSKGIQRLMESDAVYIEERNNYGGTVLHEATNMEVVRAMIREFPSLLTCKDAYGRLPLHALCTRPSTFTKIDKQNPVSVEQLSAKAQYDANQASLIGLYCLEYPQAAHRRDEEGCLPLHLCLQSKQGLSVMKGIVQAFPMAAQCRIEYAPESDTSGALNEQYASESKTQEASKHSSWTKAGQKLPTKSIHRLNQPKAPLDMMNRFLTNTDDRCAPDLPLHIALQQSIISDWKIIYLLVKAFPVACSVCDTRGLLPLVYAVLYHAPTYVIKLILDQHVPSILVRIDWNILSYSGHLVDKLNIEYIRAYTHRLAEVIAIEDVKHRTSNRGMTRERMREEEAKSQHQSNFIRKMKAGTTFGVIEGVSILELALLSTDTALSSMEDTVITSIIDKFPLGAYDKQLISGKTPFDLALESKRWKVCEYLIRLTLKEEERREAKADKHRNEEQARRKRDAEIAAQVGTGIAQKAHLFVDGDVNVESATATAEGAEEAAVPPQNMKKGTKHIPQVPGKGSPSKNSKGFDRRKKTKEANQKDIKAKKNDGATESTSNGNTTAFTSDDSSFTLSREVLQRETGFDYRSLLSAHEDPLLYAVSQGAPFQLIRLIDSLYPHLVSSERDNSQVLLHVLPSATDSIKVMHFFLNQYPLAAAKMDYFGKLPIHYICEKNGWRDEAFPVFATEAQDMYLTPLQTPRNTNVGNSNASVVSMASSFYGSTSTFDGAVLHDYVHSCKRYRLFLEDYSRVFENPKEPYLAPDDVNGMTAMEILLSRRRRNIAFIDAMLSLCPDHLWLMQEVEEREYATFLSESDPNYYTNRKDKESNAIDTFLTTMGVHEMDTTTVVSLSPTIQTKQPPGEKKKKKRTSRRVYPVFLELRDFQINWNDTETSPLITAAAVLNEYYHDLAMLVVLFSHCLPICRDKSPNPFYPKSHIWHTLVCYNDTSSTSLVAFLLQLFPSERFTMALSKDKRNRTALSRACDENRKSMLARMYFQGEYWIPFNDNEFPLPEIKYHTYESPYSPNKIQSLHTNRKKTNKTRNNKVKKLGWQDMHSIDERSSTTAVSSWSDVNSNGNSLIQWNVSIGGDCVRIPINDRDSLADVQSPFVLHMQYAQVMSPVVFGIISTVMTPKCKKTSERVIVLVSHNENYLHAIKSIELCRQCSGNCSEFHFYGRCKHTRSEKEEKDQYAPLSTLYKSVSEGPIDQERDGTLLTRALGTNADSMVYHKVFKEYSEAMIAKNIRKEVQSKIDEMATAVVRYHAHVEREEERAREQRRKDKYICRVQPGGCSLFHFYGKCPHTHCSAWPRECSLWHFYGYDCFHMKPNIAQCTTSSKWKPGMYLPSFAEEEVKWKESVTESDGRVVEIKFTMKGELKSKVLREAIPETEEEVLIAGTPVYTLSKEGVLKKEVVSYSSKR